MQICHKYFIQMVVFCILHYSEKSKMTTFEIRKTKMVDTIQQWHLTFVSFAITVGIDCKDNRPITVCDQKSNRCQSYKNM